MKAYNPKGGRPPLPKAERKIPRSIYLTPAKWEKIRRIGDGNLSAGVDRLVTAAEKTA